MPSKTEKDIATARQRRREASHQAGHAVAAWLLGYALISLTRSSVRYRWELPAESLHDAATVNAAGCAAESLLLGGIPAGIRRDFDDCYHRAAQALGRPPSSQEQADFWNAAFDRATELLRRPVARWLMGRLAVALEQRGEMTGQEAHQFLELETSSTPASALAKK